MVLKCFMSAIVKHSSKCFRLAAGICLQIVLLDSRGQQQHTISSYSK